MPKQSINLIYYSESKGQGNFGDELSKFIAEKLIDNDKYILTKKAKNFLQKSRVISDTFKIKRTFLWPEKAF